MNWHGKRYYSFDSFLKNYFGEKIYKVSLEGGFTCPNRDGTLGTGGCIFCSEGGSGDFASSAALSVTDQITAGIEMVSKKIENGKYIAYFRLLRILMVRLKNWKLCIWKRSMIRESLLLRSVPDQIACLPRFWNF